MLKKIWRLFLGLIVCASSACVTPTHASSAQAMIITRIQASGELGAQDEYVVLHNNSGVEVDVTNWCIVNKSAVLFACFTPPTAAPLEHFYVPAYGDATVVSAVHASSNGYPSEAYSHIYQSTNQSSGSIVNGSDTVSLINENSEVVDSKSWTAPISTGKVLARLKVLVGPDIYAVTNENADWNMETRTVPPLSTVKTRVVVGEEPPADIDEDPETTPEDTSNEPSSLLPLRITEIFANAAGSDVGNEFIELYNPNESEALSVDGYVVYIGINPAKPYYLPVDGFVSAGGYVVFSNSDLGYTLVNTAGRVQLGFGSETVGDPIDYASPKDGEAWALIDTVWRYTKNATPGEENSLSSIDTSNTSSVVLAETTAKKSCAANQFRNPETGRCKLLATASSAPTPCKVGQERNAETNRCRNIVAASSAAACKEGQERNPETNRCRAIVKMSNAGFGVLGVQEKNDTVASWYYWAAIGAVLLLVVSYAVWEWREELKGVWSRIRMPFAKRSD